MNKLKSKATALLLAILFAAACFAPLYGAVRASAADGSSTADMGVLYIGDNAQNAAYIEGSASDADIYCWTSNFSDWFLTEYYQGTFDNVSNTYVIFEMQQSLDMINMDALPIGAFLPDVLLTMFSSMKGNGCEIMFIFGTAEQRWAEYNYFLNYVDIHINTDIFYIFLSSVFADMKEESGSEELHEVAFIFDAGLTSHSEGSSVQEGWFFTQWFTPYFKSVYDGLTGTQYAEDVFEDNRILCHVQGSTYYDAVHDNTMAAFTVSDMAEQLSEYILCPIGYYPAENDSTWLVQMFDLQDKLGENFPIYIYNTGSSVPLLGNNIRESGQFSSIPDIIEKFIHGEDISDYDNWPGRCDITHFPMEPSEEGWLKIPSGDGPFDDCWKSFLTDEEYKFLTNQEGEGNWYLQW